MQMSVAAEAYSAAITRGVRNRTVRTVRPVEQQSQLFEVSDTEPAPYRPSVSILGSALWDKLDKHTQDWLAAILSVHYDTKRFMQLAVNAIVGHTNATTCEAEMLAYRVKSLTYGFSPEEHAAIRLYWTDALRLDRFIPARTGRAAGKFARTR